MRLYHHPMSANARRARMTAVHLELPVELVLVDLAKGEQRAPEFLRKNPNGVVPVLEDGDFVLTESHAIMQYLADQKPGQTIYPEGAAARADVNRWLFWNAHHFTPAVSVLNWERLIKPMIGQGAADPVEVARGTAGVTRFAGVLDAHLAGKTWIAQDRVTLADLAIGATLQTMVPAQLPVTGCPNVLAWFERVQGLACWKATGAPPPPGSR
jgi:glutathione S-transferase